MIGNDNDVLAIASPITPRCFCRRAANGDDRRGNARSAMPANSTIARTSARASSTGKSVTKQTVQLNPDNPRGKRAASQTRDTRLRTRI